MTGSGSVEVEVSSRATGAATAPGVATIVVNLDRTIWHRRKDMLISFINASANQEQKSLGRSLHTITLHVWNLCMRFRIRVRTGSARVLLPSLHISIRVSKSNVQEVSFLIDIEDSNAQRRMETKIPQKEFQLREVLPLPHNRTAVSRLFHLAQMSTLDGIQLPQRVDGGEKATDDCASTGDGESDDARRAIYAILRAIDARECRE